MILAKRFNTEIILKWDPQAEDETALYGGVLRAGYAYLVPA